MWKVSGTKALDAIHTFVCGSVYANLTFFAFRSLEESCKRSLDHFPNPAFAFPTPTLEFDFRLAVTLRPEPAHVPGRAHKEITAISSGTWSGSFGHGQVMVCISPVEAQEMQNDPSL